MLKVKNSKEILLMRESSMIAATVLNKLVDFIEVGLSTYDVDQEARRLIESLDAKSACHKYKGSSRILFPGYMCISVNSEVVHGIGNMKHILQDGDVVALDVCVIKNGFIGDNATTVVLGSSNDLKDRLLKVSHEALILGVEQALPGNRVGHISSAIQKHVESAGFSVVRDFVGHGVGRTMHEEPQIPNFGKESHGPKLKPGITLAIEPMVNAGSPNIRFLDDGWTAVTTDGSLSAHFEHTILVTEQKPEILTIPKI